MGFTPTEPEPTEPEPTEPELSDPGEDSEAEMERLDAELLQEVEETLRESRAIEAEHRRQQPILAARIAALQAEHARGRAETARLAARFEEATARVAALRLQHARVFFFARFSLRFDPLRVPGCGATVSSPARHVSSAARLVELRSVLSAYSAPARTARVFLRCERYHP